MKNPDLFRLSGLAAIIGGGLRALSSVSPSMMDTASLNVFYLITDIFLVFGMLGIYLRQTRELGPLGLFGFVSAMVGLLMIRTANGNPQGYMMAASVFSIGLTLIALLMLRKSPFPMGVALLWIGSFAAGMLALLLPLGGMPFVVAGLLFSTGFVWAGIVLAGTPRT